MTATHSGHLPIADAIVQTNAANTRSRVTLSMPVEQSNFTPSWTSADEVGIVLSQNP